MLRWFAFLLSALFLATGYAAVPIPATEAALRAAAQAGGDYSVTNAGVISLNTPIQIGADVRLAAVSTVTLSGSGSTRVFEIGPGRRLELQNFEIANGFATFGGGAVNNDNGFFTATACVFRNNRATGVAGQNGSNGQDAYGGAIWSSGSVWLWSCRFTSNTIVGGMGSAPPAGSQSRVCGSGGHASGGAVTSLGSLVASNCIFFANVASGGVGGSRGVGVPGSATNAPIYGGSGGAGIGGALRISGTCMVQSTVFSNNIAVGGAAGLYGGNGGPAGGGAVAVLTGNSVVSLVRFVANEAIGAAARPGFTNTSSPASNPPLDGGTGGESTGSALYVDGGQSTVDRCFFWRNVLIGGDGASGGGNTASNGTGGPGGRGGGVNGTVCIIGEMLITGSTFYENILRGGAAGAGGPGPTGGRGGNGGHSYGGALCDMGSATLRNCTIVSNSSQGGAGGRGGDSSSRPGSGGNGGNAGAGALWIDMEMQDATLESCTMAANRAAVGIGGSGGSSGGTNGLPGIFRGANIGSMGMARLRNTILASAESGDQVVGGSMDLGGNLCSDGSCDLTEQTSLNNLDPLLLPLADYGGPTMTMALRVGSPAINAGLRTDSPTTDQRGISRPDGGGYDIGAYEGPGRPQLQISRVSASTNQLRWLVEANRSYRLEQASDWSGWISLSTNNASSNGMLNVRVPAAGAGRFYRVSVE